MNKITESKIEEYVIELLEKEGYCYISPEKWEAERLPVFGAGESDLSNVILTGRLKKAIRRINTHKPEAVHEQAFKAVMNLPTQNLMENNETFHRLLTDGIEAEFLAEDGMRGNKLWLIDWENPKNNDFVVCNQFTVVSGEINKRPDVVLFVNGLPLVVIELKNATDENATVKKAFTQLQNYKKAIPALFHYNSLLIASDGLDAKAGSLTAGWSRFMAWKTENGKEEEKATVPQIETIVKGMLNPQILLDLIRHFTVFEKSKREDTETGQTFVETVKKVAAYHQYYAVKKAVEETARATGAAGDRKAGVVWHTQGSGKSLSMVFYAGEIVLALGNPTIVVITDRNDLDDQLFDTFAASKQLLRQDPTQAENRGHLKELLKTAGGGIIFTTIQKFFPENGGEEFDLLSDRKNIVVIADEAHRTQYGFGAKTVYQKNESGKEVGTRTAYGFAKYLRDGLPNASFIGFTGTPIEKEDKSTPAIFGNYIDVYDVSQAVADGATVKIYYESRLAKVHLKPEEKARLDEEVEAVTEGEESTAKEKAKAKWTQLEAIVGHNDRVKDVATDIVKHFAERQKVIIGKGMERKNLAIELLKKILNDEIKLRSKRNLMQGRKLSEMLENAIKKYQNNLLTAAEVIEELIKLAKEIKEDDKRKEEYGLSEYEIAFYDALADNNSAREVMGHDKLRELARALLEKVRANTSIDWTIKESVQAKLRVLVKRTLKRYGYPPDLAKLATDNVLKQAEMLAGEWGE